MPFNHVYTCRIVTRAKNIQMLNTLHFRAKQTAATASVVVEELEANIVPLFRAVSSAYTEFIEINATIVSAPLQDNFAQLLTGIFGTVAATPEDPRIGVWVQFRSNFTNSPYGTGGLCWGAVPHNWSMDSPKAHPECLERWDDMLDILFANYNHAKLNKAMEWGIFSRNGYSRDPDDDSKWWYPVTHYKPRGYFVTRRTRRPHSPV